MKRDCRLKENPMAKSSNILVVGSINMDLVIRARRMPAPGETVIGHDFITSPGGKGANQAVAAARLGASCAMIGRVGADAFGERLVAGLKTEGIDCAGVEASEGVSTGVAIIVVDEAGQNTIVVASGANHHLMPDDLTHYEEAFARADTVVLQLELPVATVVAAVKMAQRHGKRVILDPAPAVATLPEELCAVDVLSPNETEAEVLTGEKVSGKSGAQRAAGKLLARGAKTVILKMGGRGALAMTGQQSPGWTAAYKVNVVDTTAAGDAFTAALAVALAEGTELAGAVEFANAAGALACTRLGAQQAMPTANEVRRLMCGCGG
jgi:ribokinase